MKGDVYLITDTEKQLIRSSLYYLIDTLECGLEGASSARAKKQAGDLIEMLQNKEALYAHESEASSSGKGD